MISSFEIFGDQAAEMLSEIHSLSFSDSHWSASEIASLLQGRSTHAMVVSQEQKPIGFVMWREAVDEAEIITLCISPAHRSKGMASQLLYRFYDKTKANGIRRIFLEVNENNKAAIILYEKNGFETIGRRKAYYGGKGENKEDALIMRYSD